MAILGQIIAFAYGIWKGGCWTTSITGRLDSINDTLERHGSAIDSSTKRIAEIDDRLIKIETEHNMMVCRYDTSED